MNYRLASTIAKALWAIEPDFAESQLPLVASLLGHSPVAVEFDVHDAESITDIFSPAATAVQAYKGNSFHDVPENSTAIINLKGSLMKDDQVCGNIGMESIGRIIQSADNSDKITGILLKIDSPGGTVAGTEALAEIVSNTTTPIIAFADGLMASAAIWIGSAADEVIAASNKTIVGSIGTLMSFADFQPAYEKLGVQFHLVTADQSKDKVKASQEIKEGKYENFKKDVLNPITADFINHIKDKRPNVKEDQLTGKTFFAENVVGSLVDSIGNFQSALDRLNNLVEAKTETQNSPHITNSMNKKPLITGILGDLESSDEGVFLNEEQLTKIENSIAAGNKATTDLETATAANATVQETLDTANATIDSQKTQITALQSNAGASPAAVVVEKEIAAVDEVKDGNVTSSDKSFSENMEALKEDL